MKPMKNLVLEGRKVQEDFKERFLQESGKFKGISFNGKHSDDVSPGTKFKIDLSYYGKRKYALDGVLKAGSRLTLDQIQKAIATWTSWSDSRYKDATVSFRVDDGKLLLSVNREPEFYIATVIR